MTLIDQLRKVDVLIENAQIPAAAKLLRAIYEKELMAGPKIPTEVEERFVRLAVATNILNTTS